MGGVGGCVQKWLAGKKWVHVPERGRGARPEGNPISGRQKKFQMYNEIKIGDQKKNPALERPEGGTGGRRPR